MKKVLLFVTLLIGSVSFGQTIMVNGSPYLATQNNSFPFWLDAGSTLSTNPPMNFISVVEYNENEVGGDTNLVYSKVLSITESSVVPDGKVWKVISVLEQASDAFNISVDSLQIGDEYGGGIVFYLDGNGGGKVCSKKQHESWGDIQFAMTFSSNLIAGGYSDWYLPSIEDLQEIYISIGQIADFEEKSYSSSTPVTSNSEWYVMSFYNGNVYTDYNYNSSLIRAIRSF